jgi:tetratricopeptide (TPR) repeat protein
MLCNSPVDPIEAPAASTRLGSKAWRHSSFRPQHMEVGRDLAALAEVQLDMRDCAKAGRSYRQALAILEKALGPNHPEIAENLDSYALVLRKTGRSAEAAKLEARAAAIRS